MRWLRGTRSIASHLLTLQAVALVATFMLVAVLALAYRVPLIAHEDRARVQRDIDDVRRRLESLLGSAGARLGVVEAMLDRAAPADADRLLTEDVRNSVANALYRVEADGRVSAVGLARAFEGRADDLRGIDLSRNPLSLALAAGATMAWNGHYLSPLTAQRVVGAARRERRGSVLVSELEPSAFSRLVLAAAGDDVSAFWIIDRSGEVIADSRSGAARSRLNLRDWPMLQQALEGAVPVTHVEVQGRKVLAAVSYSPVLDWYFVARAPTGLDHPRVQELLRAVALAFGVSLLTGLLVASFWSRPLARPLQAIVARARATAQGQRVGEPWPQGPVAEFNALASELETMAGALREREQRFLTMFNAAPIPMAVVDVNDGMRLLDVNETWCRELLRERADVLGRTALQIGLWSSEERARLLAQRRGDKVIGEASILRGDGVAVQVQVYGQQVHLPSQELLVWATVDLGPLRSRQEALRQLNQELEARVAQRSAALAEANAALERHVQQLRMAQEELVRSGTMASLGGLVAGVAHELNTPLGNGVMAVSAMASVLQRFERAQQAGLKRSDLTSFLDELQQGADIGQRNLQRAAELVQSFKQVAVDQTSAKRRVFELHEVVLEMVASLRPGYARTPYRIECDVPQSGLAMDSYPGALGQVIGQLAQNALQHAFEGRDGGTLRFSAGAAEPGWVWLRAADDGHGIAAELLGRIFEPFMTTKMGRGGTGLGLYIAYTAVARLLGGTLAVQSTEGQGTCFELRLPQLAPQVPDEATAVAQGIGDAVR